MTREIIIIFVNKSYNVVAWSACLEQLGIPPEKCHNMLHHNEAIGIPQDNESMGAVLAQVGIPKAQKKRQSIVLHVFDNFNTVAIIEIKYGTLLSQQVAEYLKVTLHRNRRLGHL